MVPCRKAERDDIVFRIAEPKVHAWLLTTHSDSREWQENIALFLGLRSDLGGEACCAQPSESMLGRTRAVAPTLQSSTVCRHFDLFQNAMLTRQPIVVFEKTPSGWNFHRILLYLSTLDISMQHGCCEVDSVRVPTSFTH